MSNNIIVFGSNGFIANNFINTFAHQFNKIVCLDIVEMPTALPANVKYFNINKFSFDQIYAEIKENNFNCAINFAWKGTSGPLRDDWESQYQNVLNNQLQLALCAKLKVVKFFNLGSIMENELFIDVQAENIKKNKLYALAKYADHVLSKIFCDENGIKYINLIITNTFGVGENSPRLINTIIENYLNGKGMTFSKCNQLYSFIYIDDLINIIYILLSEAKQQVRYVIGDLKSQPLSSYIAEVYDVLNNHTKKQIFPVFNDIVQPSLSPADLDTTAVWQHTQYKLQNSFAEGIIKTYEWKKYK